MQLSRTDPHDSHMLLPLLNECGYIKANYNTETQSHKTGLG